MRPLSSVWNENKHFWLVFMKMLVFVPKTTSLHTGMSCLYHEVLRHEYEPQGKGEDLVLQLLYPSSLHCKHYRLLHTTHSHGELEVPLLAVQYWNKNSIDNFYNNNTLRRTTL